MAARQRPVDCCSRPRELGELAGATRERLVRVFRALGDGTRFEIFRLIAAQSEPICVCDVVERFDLTQPTISYHLKVLREAGLVSVSQRGVWAYYAADPDGLRLLEEGQRVLAAAQSVTAA